MKLVGAPGDLSSISVVVVDDNRNFLQIMRGVLRACGVGESFEAANAYKALEYLRNRDVDIIMTDYKMPEIDGIELISMIRADRNLPSRAAPIICVSGYSERAMVEAAIRAGADDFLVKPISPRDVLAHITHHLTRRLEYFETDSYFGPDRRRLHSDTYIGPERRERRVEV
jgi:CheY-like chemotaxis protein